jgi:hypothetical protein
MTPNWMKDKRVPSKVVYLSVVRLARKLDACAKAGKLMDDHDRARMWDKTHGQGAQENSADDWGGNDDDIEN